MLCFHKHVTWPRSDEEGCYQRCLDCGARIPYPLFDDLVPKEVLDRVGCQNNVAGGRG